VDRDPPKNPSARVAATTRDAKIHRFKVLYSLDYSLWAGRFLPLTPYVVESIVTAGSEATSRVATGKMSRKKISTTVYITPEQNERLHLLHERTKVPVAVYIREGIDLVLKRYEHALPGQMSLDATPAKSGKK
jgi:hypothetical protein